MKIIINTSSMVPIYEQIIDQIKTMIRKQELKQNDQLPSVRALSKELKISALTVKKAYDELEREGFTVTIHGKGSYVTAANTELMMEEQRKEVEQDLEGMQTMRTLANNMAWLLKCINAGKKAGIELPKNETIVRTNFIK